MGLERRAGVSQPPMRVPPARTQPRSWPWLQGSGRWAQRGLWGPAHSRKHDTDRSCAQTYRLRMEAENLEFLWPGLCRHLPPAALRLSYLRGRPVGEGQ